MPFSHFRASRSAFTGGARKFGANEAGVKTVGVIVPIAVSSFGHTFKRLNIMAVGGL